MRRATILFLMVVALTGAACGGGDDDSGASSTDVAGDATTTTEEESTTTSAGPARTDIEPCALLTADELEAQASVANVQAFEAEKQEQAAANLVAPGAFRCTHSFKVLDEGSEISATLTVEVRTKNPAAEYTKLRDFGEREREDITNLGDKAFYDVENGSITILDNDLVVIIDPGMPGIIKGTNRPVAEAVAPIVLARL